MDERTREFVGIAEDEKVEDPEEPEDEMDADDPRVRTTANADD